MQLIELKPNRLTELTQLINYHLHLISQQFTVSEDKVYSVIFQNYNPWELHYGMRSPVWTTKVYGVTQEDKLIAAGQWELSNNHNNPSSISWIVGEPNHQDAITLLIRTLLNQVRDSESQSVHVGRFTFGTGWFGIPDVWSHLHTSFEQTNFQLNNKWVVWTANISDILSKNIVRPNNIDIRWDSLPDKQEWRLYVSREGLQVGECQAWGLFSVFGDSRVTKEWMTIEWIETIEDFRKQRIAQFMLVEQARFHSKKGVKHLISWVDEINTPSLKLMKSIGFIEQFMIYDYGYSMA